MSLGQDYVIGADSTKNPRGIQHYKLFGRLQSRVTWKLAGNLGREDYQNRFRGPLNEGGLYIERQGWHQPNPTAQSWKSASPITDGVLYVNGFQFGKYVSNLGP
ncbi:hypothetical protein RJ035_001380 [Blastomyces gilchristii]